MKHFAWTVIDLTSKGVQLIASAFCANESGHSFEEIQLNNCIIYVLSKVEVAFGQRLGKMDENVSDGDADDELSDLAEEMESLIV